MPRVVIQRQHLVNRQLPGQFELVFFEAGPENNIGMQVQCLGEVPGFECGADRHVRTAYRATSQKSEPVERIAELPAVFVAGSPENPVGDHTRRPTATFRQMCRPGRKHKTERYRLDRLHRLTEEHHLVLQDVSIKLFCH